MMLMRMPPAMQAMITFTAAQDVSSWAVMLLRKLLQKAPPDLMCNENCAWKGSVRESGNEQPK